MFLNCIFQNNMESIEHAVRQLNPMTKMKLRVAIEYLNRENAAEYIPEAVLAIFAASSIIVKTDPQADIEAERQLLLSMIKPEYHAIPDEEMLLAAYKAAKML